MKGKILVKRSMNRMLKKTKITQQYCVSSTLTSILTSLKRSSSLSYMLAWTSPLDSLDRFLPSPGRPAGITASECQGSKIRNTRLTCIKKYLHLSLSIYIYRYIYDCDIYSIISLRQWHKGLLSQLINFE